MPKPAGGKHPPNVTAVIITEEERQQKLAEAPPGAGGFSGPGATVTSHQIPNVIDDQSQAMSDQLVGRAALICARKLGVPYVWSTSSHKKITLESAEVLCKKNPGLIYFDFDALEDIVGEIDNEKKATEEIEYIEEDEQITAEEDESIADLNDLAIMTELEANTELESADDPLAEEPQRLTRSEQIQKVKREALIETATDPKVSSHTITETERRAWGGTLSTPGMQVYIHPNGIARVDVQGRVKLQTGISGNVRIFRIQALERPTGGVVRNVTRTTVTGPKAPAQPPQSSTRHMQDDRIPVPSPPKVDLDKGTDY
jgi:hypothetical protein